MTQDEFKNQMAPKLREKYLLGEKKCNERGLYPKISCVTRAPRVQLALVLQGRSINDAIAFLEAKYPNAKAGVKPLIRPLIQRLKETKLSAIEFCNAYRKEIGLPSVHPSNWYEVTWTVNSNHFPNKDGLGEAVDFFFSVPGHEWDIKLDHNKSGGPDFDEAGKIFEEVGLVWGGRFKDSKGKPKPDRPHVELAMKDRA